MSGCDICYREKLISKGNTGDGELRKREDTIFNRQVWKGFPENINLGKIWSRWEWELRLSGGKCWQRKKLFFYAIRFGFSILFSLLKKSQCSLEIDTVKILKCKLWAVSEISNSWHETSYNEVITGCQRLEWTQKSIGYAGRLIENMSWNAFLYLQLAQSFIKLCMGKYQNHLEKNQ